MAKKNRRTRQQNSTKPGAAGGITPKKFTAPTSGLEDLYVTWGTPKDAAKFKDMVSLLAKNVGKYTAVAKLFCCFEGHAGHWNTPDRRVRPTGSRVLEGPEPDDQDKEQDRRKGQSSDSTRASQGGLGARPGHR